MNWQPADTAPYETDVLIFDRDEGVCSARCSEIRGKRFWLPHPTSRDSDSFYDVTHWAPLPDGP